MHDGLMIDWSFVFFVRDCEVGYGEKDFGCCESEGCYEDC